MADQTVSWFAAVDWGAEHHQVGILDIAGRIKGERSFHTAVPAWPRSAIGWFP